MIEYKEKIQYDKDEKVTLFNNELFINRQNGEQIERITDSNFLIGNIRYHLECQSTADGTILYRIFEYDSQIALQNSELRENELRVKFPKTAILYLRHNNKTPNSMRIIIETPDINGSYTVPVMKVQNYSIEKIFDKGLLFLIPFYIFSYEHDFEKYESDADKLKELTHVYEEIVEKLDEYIKQHAINVMTKGIIIDMSKKVSEHLAKKYSKVKKGVGDIMGGKILDYPTKDAFKKGKKEQLISQIQKKLAKGKSIEIIADEVEESLDTVTAIIKELEANYIEKFKFSEKISSVTWMDNNTPVEYTQDGEDVTVQTVPYQYGRDLVVRIAKIVCE